MNTLHFRYAVEIEKTRSITQAAENLYMAQPNLSKAIKELENTLGITIFKRTSKGVIPTEQGMKFLECAKQILIQINNMEEIHSPDKMQKQKIRISVPRADYISKAFAEFTSCFDTTKDIEVYLHETNALSATADIREHGYDFGIIRFRKLYERYFMDYLAEKSLESQILWEYKMLAVMPENNSMAGAENIRYEELSETSTELIYGDDSIPYISPNSTTEEHLDSGKKNNKVCLFDRGSVFDMFSAMPQTFMLVPPVPQDVLKLHNLIQRKCELHDNDFCDLIIYSSGHKMSESEIEFVNRLYEARNKVAFEEYL